MKPKVPASSGAVARPVEVLVVEDHEDTRAMMVALLTASGYVVRAVASAEAAHDAALARVPDVVVTDLQLVGGAAGWILAEALRVEPRTKHVALIAVSGVVEPRRQVVAPFDAYVTKPIQWSLLLNLVHQLATIGRARRGPERAAQ